MLIVPRNYKSDECTKVAHAVPGDKNFLKFFAMPFVNELQIKIFSFNTLSALLNELFL
jgi:hypothetical protein